MTRILVDHDSEGYALLLLGTLASEGWLDLVQTQLVRFSDVGLPLNSNDRDVWQFAQSRQMYLLTNNRNMDAPDSLEQTLREENRPTSLPVLTLSRVDKITDRTYRERCAIRLLEIVLDPRAYLGAGRLYLP